MKKQTIRTTDYGKHLIWFEDAKEAEAAKEYLRKKDIRVVRMDNELGFASEKTRDKVIKILDRKGYIGLVV